MITGFIINAVYIALYNLIDIFPNGSGLDSNISSSFTTMVGYAYSYSWLLPIGTLITVLIIAVTFQSGILLFKIINWIIGKIRGSN